MRDKAETANGEFFLNKPHSLAGGATGDIPWPRASRIGLRRAHTRKSRQGFPRRPVPLRCVCLEVCRAERCSKRSPGLLATGRTAFIKWGCRCVAGVSGPTFPRCEPCCHWRWCWSSQHCCP